MSCWYCTHINHDNNTCLLRSPHDHAPVWQFVFEVVAMTSKTILPETDGSHIVGDEASLELAMQNFTAMTHRWNWSDMAYSPRLLVTLLIVDLLSWHQGLTKNICSLRKSSTFNNNFSGRFFILKLVNTPFWINDTASLFYVYLRDAPCTSVPYFVVFHKLRFTMIVCNLALPVLGGLHYTCCAFFRGLKNALKSACFYFCK